MADEELTYGDQSRKEDVNNKGKKSDAYLDDLPDIVKKAKESK